MSQLRLFFLGSPRLERGRERLEINTRKSVALMAYLAITGQAHRREALMTLLWPNSRPRQARSTLRTILSGLNKTLAGEGLLVERDKVGLDLEADIWLDVAQFQQLAQSWQAHEHPQAEVCADCLGQLAEAVSLCRGDFLEGFTLRDSPGFDDWQAFETGQLRRELAAVLEKLVRGHQAQGHLDPAFSYAQRWLALDPLYEPAHRFLMQLYAESGNRSAALRQYQTCCELLEDELEVRPEAETIALYERIRQETSQHVKMVAESYGLIDGDTPEGLAKNLLGQGGMGNVYRGIHIQSGEPVAIKLLKPEIVASSPDLVARFVREGEALRQLNHPNIVKLLAAAERDGQHYLIMEFVDGGSLRDMIKQEKPLSISRILELALDLSDALTRAHRLNIIHRDLKPANVLLAQDGTPRLTDFGIARLADSSQITETGLLVGTINYLSPEGCDGHRLDERADIWAFGAVLFEMLTGERPFIGETMSAILAAIMTQPTPNLNQFRSDIPAPLADLVYRMLLKDREQRIPSVRLVGAELEAILADRPMTPTTPLPVPVGPPPPCPYRGLFAFQEEDAPFFFGRETYTEILVEAVQSRGLVAVIGPSGSGKSSVVQAGVVARLREESGWLIEAFRPGSDPFQGLAATLLPLLEPDLSATSLLVEVRRLVESLKNGELPLADVVEQILQKQPEAARFLLVVDQFEELYTLCPEPEIRYSFLDLLFEIIDLQQYQAVPKFTLIFTLRADFLAQALAHRPFADAIQGNDFKLGPMIREELGQAIEYPAEKRGVTFETGLVERILDDVGEEPGNLPLLEFALTTLWEQQQARQLSHSGYETIARVEGALTRHADEVYARLSPAEQVTARRLFTQLVRPGEGIEDTRRLALRKELKEADWRLAQDLADARLVVTSRDAAGQETVEVVHEALIRSWGQLRRWMESDRTFRTWQEQLRAALRQWEMTDPDEGALLRGLPLAEAENWLSQREGDLSQTERTFIQASLALRERRAQEQEARRQRELEAAQKLAAEAEARRQVEAKWAEEQALAADNLRKRAIWLAGVGIVAATLAVVAIVFGLQSSQNAKQAQANAEIAATRQTEAQRNANLAADREAEAITAQETAVGERKEAERQAKLALSRQLAVEVGQQLDSGNFDMALLLGIEAVRIADTVEAFSAVRQALNHPNPLLFTLSGHKNQVEDAIWNADESRILTGSDDGTARVWDAETGEELVTLSGHTDLIYRVMWNMAGNRILTASFDGTARMWDAETGQELLTLAGHTAQVFQATWNAHESRILTASWDGTARVWDAKNGAELLTLSGHAGPVLASWNANGSRILTHGFDGTARLWDAETGQELLNLSGHAEHISHAVWNADESRILTASWDHTVKVWDTETGQELLILADHTDAVNYAVLNKTESRILTASDDGTARVWDAKTGDRLLVLSGHTAGVKQATWNPDESLILTASDDGTARVWDAEIGAELGVPLAHSVALLRAVWNVDGSRILTASTDKTARVWDWGKQKAKPELPMLNGFELGVYQAIWNADESQILTLSGDAKTQVWDARSGTEILTLSGHTDRVWQAVWNADESRILTAGLDGTARVWDAETGAELLTLVGHEGWVRQAMWNSDDTRILTTGQDGTIRVWNAETGAELLFLSGHTDLVYSALWSADESRILSASWDGTARVWDTATGQELLTLDHMDEVWWAVWNSDESRVLTAGTDGTARVWDAETGEELLNIFEQAEIWQAVWNDDESRILTASSAGTAKIWDAETGSEPLTFSGHTGEVSQAWWNSDETRILTAGGDGTVRVWDAKTGTELVNLSDHTAWVNQAWWSADGSRILTASDDSTVRQYFTRLEELLAVACERVSRNLTQPEWQQFMGEQPYRATCPDLPVPEE